MKYNTILFDLDGTLLNTLEDLTDSVNMTLEKEGYPLRTREEVQEFIGSGARTLMKRALPEGIPEEEVTRCLADYRQIYLRNMFRKTCPYEGIAEMLKQLKAQGIKIGVVSNKPDDATREMCRTYFGSDLDASIGDNHERRRKPAPDNLYEILKQLGSEKEMTLYVGDSDVDVITAKNAGLDCVAVSWGFRSREILRKAGADHIIDDPKQLISLLGEIKSK